MLNTMLIAVGVLILVLIAVVIVMMIVLVIKGTKQGISAFELANIALENENINREKNKKLIDIRAGLKLN